MTFLGMVLLPVLLALVQAAPHSNVMRTADVDYTGRVRQAPGGNSIQVGGRNEVRDEEDEANTVGSREGQEEEGDDWQSQHVPELKNPMQFALHQLSDLSTGTNSLIDRFEKGVIRDVAAFRAGTLREKDSSTFSDLEDTVTDFVAKGVESAANGTGMGSDALETILAVSKQMKGKLKQATRHDAGEPVTPFSVLQNAIESLPGFRESLPKISKGLIPNVMANIAPDASENKDGDVLWNGQIDLEKLKEMAKHPPKDINDVMRMLDIPAKVMKNMDPATALKVTLQMAKLAEDVNKALAEGKKVQSDMTDIIGEGKKLAQKKLGAGEEARHNE